MFNQDRTFLVQLPSTLIYVDQAHLSKVLGILADTRYVDKAGQFLQTVTFHQPLQDFDTTSLYIQKPFDTVAGERDNYKELFEREREKVRDLQSKKVKNAKRTGK